MSLFGFPEGLAGGSKETSYQTDYNTAFPTAYTTSRNTDKSTAYNTSHATTNAPTSWTTYSYALGGSWRMVNGEGSSTFWQRHDSWHKSVIFEVVKPQHEGYAHLGWVIRIEGNWYAHGRRFWQWVGANYNFGTVYMAAKRSGWSVYGMWNGLQIGINMQPNRGGAYSHDRSDRRTGSQTFHGIDYANMQPFSFQSYYYCEWRFWYAQIRFGVQRTSHGETSQLTNKDTTYSTSHITSSPTSYSTDYTTEQLTQRQTDHITYG